MNFKPSDKVVCVSAFNLNPGCLILEGSMPKANVVYVVRGFYTCPIVKNDALYLVGIKCNRHQIGLEFGWDNRGFRKLEDIQAENQASRSDAAFLKEALELINTDPESLP
jgi:hypothetical protein